MRKIIVGFVGVWLLLSAAGLAPAQVGKTTKSKKTKRTRSTKADQKNQKQKQLHG